MNAIEAHVEFCQAKGLTPQEGLILFHEKQTFCFEQWLSPEEQVREGIPEILAIRAQLMKAINAIDSSQALRSYAMFWGQAALGKPQKLTNDDEDDFNTLAELLFGNEDIGYAWANFADLDGLKMRLSGSFVYSSAWNDIQQMPMDWDDLRHAMQRHQMKAAPVPDSRLATPEERQAFETMAQGLGLRSLQWPWLGGSQVGQLDPLARQLNQVDVELQSQMGLDGPILGLKGRTRLALGLGDLGGNSFGGGDTFGTPNGRIMVVTSPDAGLGSIAHEIFHGLDMLVGQAAGLPKNVFASQAPQAQAHHPMVKPWLELVHRLDHFAEVDEMARIKAKAFDEARSNMAQRLIHYLPEESQRLDFEVLVAEAAKPQWNKKKVAAQIQGVRTQLYNDSSYPVALMAEFTLLNDRAKTLADPQHSLWKTFRMEHERLNLRHEVENPGYASQPEEMLAFAFEARFPQGSTSSDRVSGHTSLSYPMPAETQAQDVHWQKFFKALAPIWQALPDLSSPRPRLARTLGEAALDRPVRSSRKASAQGSALASALPEATEARRKRSLNASA